MLYRLALTGSRLFLGLIFLTAGMGKLTHGGFPGLIGPVWLEERLATYGLGLFAQFVAWSQLLIGLLLLSKRFALIGAIMLVPMLANIFVITVSLQWRGTPYVNAVLLAMNALLLWGYRDRLKLLFIDDDRQLPARVTRRAPKLDLIALIGILVALLGPILLPLGAAMPYVAVLFALALFAYSAWCDRRHTAS